MPRLSAISTIAMAYFVGFSSASAGPVTATHSVPSPRYWWDKDDDGVVDATDGDVGFFKAGTGWAPDSQGNDFASRFNEALAVWKNGTDYDPWTTSVTSNLVWVDGRRNTADTIPWEPGYLAVTTRLFVTRATYFDLYDTDIFLNTEDELWWRQPGAPSVGCGALGCYSARGVFTHELGHTVRLIDLSGSNCPPGPTMCGEALSTGDSDRLYTLTSDDIDGANAVY